MLLFSLAIYYWLVRSIRRPLAELSRTSSKLQSGDLSARSRVNANNEFGELSISLNSMAASLQNSVQINTMVNEFTQKILLGADPKGYFSELLCALAQLTHSQLAAIYLINDTRTSFELHDSLGGDVSLPSSFSALKAEGEFGIAVKTGAIQRVGGNSATNKLQFKAVSGTILANEIITVPLVSGGEVFAILSLATIEHYHDFTIEFLNRVSSTISAHTTSMITFKKLQEYSRLLSEQNTELETQKSALVSQSSELQQQNVELQIQKEQLNEVSRLKTSFLSNMSHELRTPLNSVIALSGVLHRRLTNLIPDDEYSYIQVIERNGKHLLALINDILDISRIEAGREEIILSRFNVCEQINDVVQMIKPQADAKSIELKVAKGACEVSIESDAYKFKHIVQNLLSNAVKFTEAGWIEIVVAIDNQYIHIQVMDSGIGISKKQLPHIFDEFRQADSSTSRKYGGTGLGLAIARKYAQILGGSLKAESEEQKGSVFILTLPLNLPLNQTLHNAIRNETLQISQNTAQPIRDFSKQKPIVLLIEDSEPAIVQIKDVLLDMDFEIQAFDNGLDALNWSLNNKVDAVILDLMMPNMDGFEILAKLRAADFTQTVPVLILTAKHITPDELRFLKGNHIFQLIQKGDVNRNELRSTIQKMVYVTQPSAEHHPVDKPSNSGRPLLLVVEDNLDNLLTVNALLAESYDVIEAYNGLDAVHKARTHQPNLILMDIALPVMDGVEAFKAIRKDPFSQHIPVIALTASALISDRELILAHGFDAYIAKPIDVDPFYKTINAILYGK
jgi:signal transduction histidine kinase/CheY-like chemotaxis protein/HAMP domain-containing protein